MDLLLHGLDCFICGSFSNKTDCFYLSDSIDSLMYTILKHHVFSLQYCILSQGSKIIRSILISRDFWLVVDTAKVLNRKPYYAFTFCIKRDVVNQSRLYTARPICFVNEFDKWPLPVETTLVCWRVTGPQGSYLFHSGHKGIIEAVTQMSDRVTCCLAKVVIRC